MLIVHHSAIQESYHDWAPVPCDCGNKYCIIWKLNFTLSEGRMLHNEALLAAGAPRLLKAIVKFLRSPSVKILTMDEIRDLEDAVKSVLSEKHYTETCRNQNAQ